MVEFKVGDVVVLKGGRRLLTVSSVNNIDDRINGLVRVIEELPDNSYETHLFPALALELNSDLKKPLDRFPELS